MYTTKQAIDMLLKCRVGLTFVMIDNPNIHIFKSFSGEICKGEYGNGAIIMINSCSFPNELWRIDFKGSKFKRELYGL